MNRFRGDRRLLEPGLEMLTARTGVPVLGVVPFIAERLVPAEDSLDLEPIAGTAPCGTGCSAVIGGVNPKRRESQCRASSITS